jgi:hypothetical protein
MADSPLALEASFERLSATVPATVGIAIASPDAAVVHSLGSWSTGVAWSTIKVPLAVAALRANRSHAKDLVVKAITKSDNPASEELWSQLGEPAAAARRLQAILEESGDTATVVESQRIRPGFTAFGQTQWTLARQARFAAQLPGLPGAACVIDHMRHLATDQRWGLAAKGIAAKGGWGPGSPGADYLVRQFGILPTETGHLGVALAAETSDGMFATGIDVLNRMTDWLVSHFVC